MLVWRPAFIAGLLITGAARIATAQTVIVREATPGAPADLLINDQLVTSATVDAAGNATLTGDIQGRLGRTEAGMRVTVDTCDTRRRVMLVEVGVQPPPSDGVCRRAAVPYVFSVQPGTTFVVEVGAESPQVWIHQGPAPLEWVGEQLESTTRRSIWKPAPTGIVLSAGLGGANFSDTVTQACGDAYPCSGQNLQANFSAAATYWVTPNLAVGVGFLRPAIVKTSGSGSTFTFNSALDARLLMVDGQVGMHAGPVRLYGLGGVNRMSATSTTQQSLTTGTAETFAFQAGGWGWVGGAGVEAWATTRIGFFAEADVVRLNGTALGNAEGSISDTLVFATVGARVAIGRPARFIGR